MMFRVVDVLTSEWLWLPPNITWADITNGPDKKFVYTEMWDILYQIPMTLFLLALRVWMTKKIFIPLGKAIGVPEKNISVVQYHPELESAYKSSYKLMNAKILAKKLDMTERQVERWFRKRRFQDKPTKMVKFCETSWKATFLFAITTFGFYIVMDEDWFWHVDKILANYPNKSLSQGEWWYYLMITSFYWSLIITHFTDVRHKDFWQMLMHHIIVLALLLGSWTVNFYQYGLALLPVQDSSEILLQLTKSVHYAKLHWMMTYTLMIVFVVWWIVERVYIFPVKYIWVIVESVVKLYGLFPTAVAGIAALMVFMVLQLWWTWLILIIIYNTFVLKKPRDVRSSASEISDSDEDNHTDGYAKKKTTLHHGNTNTIRQDHSRTRVVQ